MIPPRRFQIASPLGDLHDVPTRTVGKKCKVIARTLSVGKVEVPDFPVRGSFPGKTEA